MIREDYILAWIKRYVQWLMEIAGLVQAQNYQGAIRRIDLVLRALLDLGPDSVTSLSEGEILARLALGDPPQLVQERCVVIAVALRQLGHIAAAQGRSDTARDCRLKALHLVLGLRLQGAPTQLAEYAPPVEDLFARTDVAASLEKGGCDAPDDDDLVRAIDVTAVLIASYGSAPTD